MAAKAATTRSGVQGVEGQDAERDMRAEGGLQEGGPAGFLIHGGMLSEDTIHPEGPHGDVDLAGGGALKASGVQHWTGAPRETICLKPMMQNSGAVPPQAGEG